MLTFPSPCSPSFILQPFIIPQLPRSVYFASSFSFFYVTTFNLAIHFHLINFLPPTQPFFHRPPFFHLQPFPSSNLSSSAQPLQFPNLAGVFHHTTFFHLITSHLATFLPRTFLPPFNLPGLFRLAIFFSISQPSICNSSDLFFIFGPFPTLQLATLLPPRTFPFLLLGHRVVIVPQHPDPHPPITLFPFFFLIFLRLASLVLTIHPRVGAYNPNRATDICSQQLGTPHRPTIQQARVSPRWISSR